MPLNLPLNPDREHLKTLAKELVKSARAGEPKAMRRFADNITGLAARPTRLRLAHAQTVIAREYGFPSWPKLKAYLDTRPPLDLSAAGMISFRKRPSSEIGAVWVQLASELDFERLVPAFALGRTKGLAVRDRLVADGTLGVLVDALLVGVRHHNPNVRHVCAHMMDSFADERCAPVLAQLLDDPVPRVRRIAVHSIGCDDCKIVPWDAANAGAGSPFGRDVVGRIVEMALSDPSIQVRRHATVALDKFEDARVTQAIGTLLVRETDAAIRRYARGALRSIRAKAG